MFQRSYIRSISTIEATRTSDKQTTSGSSNNNKGLSDVTAQQLARTSKSQQQQIQLKSSFCRIVIAISTLRRTKSTATPAAHHYLTPPTAATLTPINLLKLFLICCYYLVFIASFLMIIIYVNQIGESGESLLLQKESVSLKSTTGAFENVNYQKKNLTRVSRSVSEESGIINEPNWAIIQPIEFGSLMNPSKHSNNSRSHLPLSSASSSIGIMESRISETRTTFESHRTIHRTQNQLPPLTSRQRAQSEVAEPESAAQQVASDYSVNNRGTITLSASVTNPVQMKPQASENQGQWIPIVNSARTIAESSSQIISQEQNRQPKFASTTINRPTVNSSELRVAEPMLPAHSLTHNRESTRPNRQRTFHHSHNHNNNNQYHHQYHQHNNNRYKSYQHHHNLPNLQMESHPSYNRHWRRPRFNLNYDGPPRMSKIYKIVLLCDKTLVSLDYIKRFTYEPTRPYVSNGPFPVDPDFIADDNDIDLDTNLDPIYAASRRHQTIAPLLNNASSSSTESTTTTTPPLATQLNDPLASEPNEQHKSETLMMKRSHLSEDDPLIRCDMWDLEKGLKNRKPPREILQIAMRADFDTVRDAINRCRQLSEKMLPPDDEYRDGIEIMSTEDFISLFSMKRGLIPGTKWCGLGDMASSYNDLGPKHRIDICCRAHDHCPIRLKPFRNDYGVLNIALYTKSHCDCDADFYRCLREVHSRTADMLGNLYFNVMKLQCMREERMKVCREMRPIALGFERCVRYEENPMRTVFKFTTPPVAY